MQRNRRRYAIPVRRSEYFNHIDSLGCVVDRYNSDYGVMSVAVVIPPDPLDILYPTDNREQISRGMIENILPATLRTRLNKLGYMSDPRRIRTGGDASNPIYITGSRQYILRPHRRPITRDTYREIILPAMERFVGGTFEDGENTLDQLYIQYHQQQHQQQESVNREIDALRLTAGADNPRDADAFMRTLPADIANFFGF